MDLLRLGILLAVAVVLFNAMKTGQMGQHEMVEEAEQAPVQMAAEEEQAPMEKQALLEKVQENVRLNDAKGLKYDVEAGIRPHQEEKSQLYDYNYQVLPYPQIATNPTDSYFTSGGVCQPSDPGCYSGSVLQAPDLLPQDSGTAWDQTSPQSQGLVTDQNFLESGHHYGINTVGQSLKNANRQLRSDPPIPKVNIGPWNGSTTDADSNRKGFEIEA